MQRGEMATEPTRGSDPDLLSRGLAGLWGRVAGLDPAAPARAVRDVLYGNMWLVVRLEDGSCGRAFAFTGAHEVYGPFDMGVLTRMRRLVGAPVGEAFAYAASDEGARELGPVLAGALAVAALNAAAAPLNEPESLAARGFSLLEDCVGELVRPTDRVAVVGAGMFLRELAATCPPVDVVDLRPACDLMSARVTADGVETAPAGVRFHTAPDDTEALFASADVLFLTGCTLVNGTFFDLMALPRRARDVVLFGPSAAGPFDALAELGVTCVATSRVVDPEALADATLAGLAARQMPREASRPHVAAVPRGQGDGRGARASRTGGETAGERAYGR